MKGMFAGIHAIQHNLHDFILLQDEGDRVCAVYRRVWSHVAGGQGGVEGWDLGPNVGEVVEKGVIGAVTEVAHLYVEFDGVIDLIEDGEAVVGHKDEIVERFEGVDQRRRRQWSGFVVDEPAGDVWVESFWDGVEEILHRDQLLIGCV